MKPHHFLYCFAFLFLLGCRPTQALQKEHIASAPVTAQTIAQNGFKDTIRPHAGTDQLVKAGVAYDSIAFQRNLYEKSFTAIRSMLEGRRAASFKDAVFLVENAFANGQLDEQLYNQQIAELQTLAQLYSRVYADDFDYAFPDRDTILQHAGLFATMKDTIVFDFDSLLLLHLPMTYNPIDFNGEQDWKSTFVSTLLQTGTGNCQSLAYLYNILAEQSGLESHLALAPNHIYVKRSSRKTGMYNTELTNGTFPVDAWIMTSGYVNLQTIQNGLYMQPLGDQQELALCLLDLAKGYEKIYGIGDGEFMLRCATTSLAYFPGCISAKLLKEKVLGKLADQNMAVALEHQKLVAELYNSGYRNMPEEQYLDWLSGKSAANRPTENHQPFGRFESKTDRTRTATLSKGAYDEFFTDDTLAAIGRSLFDTRTLAVVGFAEEKPFSIDPETAYRFFAVDPLAAKYPHNSPYAFSENRVIDGIELEGLEVHLFKDNNGNVVTKPEMALWRSDLILNYARQNNLLYLGYYFESNGVKSYHNPDGSPREFAQGATAVTHKEEQPVSQGASVALATGIFILEGAGEATVGSGGTASPVAGLAAGAALGIVIGAEARILYDSWTNPPQEWTISQPTTYPIVADETKVDAPTQPITIPDENISGGNKVVLGLQIHLPGLSAQVGGVPFYVSGGWGDGVNFLNPKSIETAFLALAAIPGTTFHFSLAEDPTSWEHKGRVDSPENLTGTNYPSRSITADEYRVIMRNPLLRSLTTFYDYNGGQYTPTSPVYEP